VKFSHHLDYVYENLRTTAEHVERDFLAPHSFERASNASTRFPFRD
jgi:hypothetical protein